MYFDYLLHYLFPHGLIVVCLPFFYKCCVYCLFLIICIIYLLKKFILFLTGVLFFCFLSLIVRCLLFMFTGKFCTFSWIGPVWWYVYLVLLHFILLPCNVLSPFFSRTIHVKTKDLGRVTSLTPPRQDGLTAILRSTLRRKRVHQHVECPTEN